MVFFWGVGIIKVMSNEPKKSDIKRVVGALKRSSQKYVPLEKLAHLVGLYADVLSDELVYFDPMIRFDPTVNTRNLLAAMEQFLGPETPKEAVAKPKRIVVTSKELNDYVSISDFVFKKMTSVGGLVDTASNLSDQDLAILKKLVDKEVTARKKAKHKRKKAA